MQIGDALIEDQIFNVLLLGTVPVLFLTYRIGCPKLFSI
jgi:hypothetical protein